MDGSAWAGAAAALCPCSLCDFGRVTRPLGASPPPSGPWPAQRPGTCHVGLARSAWHRAGAAWQRGVGLGARVLTVSGARVSGRLALGGILAAGDVLEPVDFSAGGGAVGGADQEALRGLRSSVLQPEAPQPCGAQLSGLFPPAPSLGGLAPGRSSSASSWSPGVFSVTAFQAPGEGSRRGDGGSEAPSLCWGLSLSPEVGQRQGE